MEKSIKRVEKLVQVTNSALAQMKFSLMFDDMNGNGGPSGAKPLDPALGKTFAVEDDLKQCQSEFKSEANEMLAKMESMFGPNEAVREKSKAVDKIKEINRKLNLRLERSKLDETEQSRQKLLNLINEEKFSSGVTSSWDSVQSKGAAREKSSEMPSEMPPKRTHSLLTTTKSPSKDELKSKILETQDIVNRGFQTARQLAQKVETMSKHERREKTPSTNKTMSEINLRGLERKAESSETVSTVKCRKCATRARRRREIEEAERGNTRVIEIKREEVQRCRRSNLQLQRLPSVHIRGGLQMQKVHNLEIPAGGDTSAKSNTAVSFLSHEQMKNEKVGEIIERVRKENCCCSSNNPQGSYVECFNCGKLIRVRETCVDPRRVDEILLKCDFDVFDPRIDEFVEKCGTFGSVNPGKTQQPDAAPLPDKPTVEEVQVTAKKTTDRKKEERPKKSSPKIQYLSDQLLKKYKEETEALESNHLKLENILQGLFKRIDESRELFENCHLLKSEKSYGGIPPKLTATKPVVVNVTEGLVRNRTKYRQLHKQQTNNMNRSREESVKHKPDVQKPRETKSKDKDKRRNQMSKEERFIMSSSCSEMLPDVVKASSGMSSSTSCSSNQTKNVFEKVVDETPSIQYRKTSARDFGEKETCLGLLALTKNKTVNLDDIREKTVVEEKAPSLSSSSSSKSRRTGQTDCSMPKARTSSQISKGISREDEAETKAPSAFSNKSKGSESDSDESENNYESDFESVTNEPNENECEEAEPDANFNKLSTISEVDSELEKKVSDEQKTMRSGQNIEMDDSSKPSETGRRDTKKCHEDEGLLKRKEENSDVLEVLPESKKTEVTSPKTGETCSKSTPTELVTSLKDILSALQDQFVRTESLAEKLTENVKSEGAGKPEPGGMTLFGDLMLNTWKKSVGLVENLRSARKDLRVEPESPRRSERSKKSGEANVFSADSLSDEGGSSLGEIIQFDRRRASEKSASSSISEDSFLRLESGRKSAGVASNRRESSAFKLEVSSEEVLYSEGEIPSDEALALERFGTSSLGEVVSRKNSTASTL